LKNSRQWTSASLSETLTPRTIDGAQAMLDLRSTHINDQWPAFQAHRIQAKTQRLYPQRQLQQLQFQLAD
jgi:hypothetical protein